MSILEETDSRFVNLETKVGLFMVMAVAAIAITIAYIGAKQDLFSPKARLDLVTASGRGIHEGQPVKLSGFTIGKVEKVSLTDSASVRVDLSINRGYMKWIRTDSKARLIQEGVIGENIIEITPGSETAQPVGEGETLSLERVMGLQEMLEELDDMKGILTEIKAGGLKESFANLNQLSAELLDARGHMDTFLDSAEQTIGRIDSLVGMMERTTMHTDRTMAKMDSLVDSAKRVSTGAEESLPVILENMIDATEHIRTVATSAGESVPMVMENMMRAIENIERVSEQVLSIVTKGDDLVDDTGAVIDSVKKTWPIRSHIDEPQARSLEVDSYD